VGALHALVDRGRTIVAIENNLGFVGAADHVIDLGPGGGDDGGRVLAMGTPEEIAAADTPTDGACGGTRGRPEDGSGAGAKPSSPRPLRPLFSFAA